MAENGITKQLHPVNADEINKSLVINDAEQAERQPSIDVGDSSVAPGANRAEAMRAVWGKHGLKIIWFGMALMLIV